jgi:hypothetical protein
MNLEEFKSGLIDNATTYRFFGHQLDDSSAKARRDGRKWLPFSVCFCVQDSPDSPCHCMHDGIWWILEGSILNRGHAERRDHEGKSMDFIDVSLDAEVVAETVTAISVRSLKEIGNDLPKVADAFGGGSLGVVFSARSKVWKFVASFLLAVGSELVASISYDVLKAWWEQRHR